uniref:Ubiquitin-like protease family profile domain-containing protein n=1 Tax=Phytophthora ramorum TaxID=164328 RepID=H3GE63_PHYRM
MDKQRRLSGVLVKYAEVESKKPKYKLMKNPVAVKDPFYVLPDKLLSAAISVDDSQEAAAGARKGSSAGQVETAVIKDVDLTFVRIQNLRKDVQLGLDMHKWLTVQGIPALPAEYHDIGNKQVAESGVEAVLFPLNFLNDHWCCVVVSVDARRMFYYDPLNQAPYLKSAMAMATQLKIAGLQEYDVIAQNNPIQFDAFSCGVYVCWMFIRHMAKGPPLDMSLAVLPRRRFELFYYLLSGRLLPKEGVVQHDEKEEKTLAPLAGGNDRDEENLPPTQVTK